MSPRLNDVRLPSTFWAKVQVAADGCWLWTAALNSRGYPCFGIRGRSQLAHRVAYWTLVAPIPAGMEMDHLCRVPRCVNPAHLEPVTREENLRRAMEVNLPTHCPQGHPYDESNTYVKHRWDGRINRTCRTCVSAARAARRLVAAS